MAEQTCTILIVDDDQLTRDMMMSAVRRAGHAPLAAENGYEALDILNESYASIDTIVLDLMMPGLDGFGVLAAINEDERWRHIPVIMASADSDIENVIKGISMGAADYMTKPFRPALLQARINATLSKKLMRDQERDLLAKIQSEKARADALLNVIVPLGASLVNERDFNRLLERILLEAMSLCEADGGTLYLRDADEDALRFVMVQNNSLGLQFGGTTGAEIPFAPLPLRLPDTGQPNHNNVATYAALSGETVNIPDAYEAEGFDFSGTRAFDEANSYRSQSFLAIPLKQADGEVSGVLQLINATDPETGETVPFYGNMQQLVEALAALAASSLAAYEREARLREQIENLRIEIDETRKAQQVEEITTTDYFVNLREQANDLRKLMQNPGDEA